MSHRTEFRARVRAEQAANGGNLEEALIAVLADALEDARPKASQAKPVAAEPAKAEKPAEPKAEKKPAKRKPGRPRKGA